MGNVFKLLEFGFCNVNCLTSKMGDASSVIKSLNIYVFGIIETWLTSAVRNSLVSFHGYQIVNLIIGAVVKADLCSEDSIPKILT